MYVDVNRDRHELVGKRRRFLGSQLSAYFAKEGSTAKLLGDRRITKLPPSKAELDNLLQA